MANLGFKRNVGSRFASGVAASMGDENISAKFCGEFSDAAKLDKVLVFLAEHHVEEMPAVFSKELGPEVTRESFHLLAIRNAADIVEYLIKI